MANQNNKANPQQFTYKRRNYTNSIPIAQLACPVKFLNLPFQNIERYAKCSMTKLQDDYKYEVWPEEILKHCPPLVDLNIFKRDENAVLNEKDALLLEDDFAVQNNSKRSQQHSKIVPWMRKTEYISTEFNRYGVNADRSENKVGYNMKKKMGNQDNLFKDQASQIEAIKKTFTDAAKPVKRHYSKPGVHAVEEIMLLPDEDQAKFSYAQVIFDADPLPSTKESNKLQERAVLKGMKDQDGNNFVAYFVPTEETLTQKLTEEGDNINYTPGYEYKYVCGREYNWTVHTKQSHGPDVEAYFFTQRNGIVYYCEVDTRVKLNRRAKMSATSRHSMLLLSHREYTEDELKAMERRKNKLYDPYSTGEYIPLENDEEEEDQESEIGDQESETEEQKTETKEETEKQEVQSEKSSDSSSSDSEDQGETEKAAKNDNDNGNQSDSSSSQSSQSS